MKRTFLFLALSLIINLAQAQVKMFCDKTQSTITYSMHHPLHSWTGVSKDVNSVIVTDENVNVITQVAVSVKIASFDSQNANRDSHAIEVTEAILYPSISFISNQIKEVSDNLSVTGILKFHNVSKSITFLVEKTQVDNKTKIRGNFKVKMSQFNIEPPSLMGIATDDEFEISFEVFFKSVRL